MATENTNINRGLGEKMKDMAEQAGLALVLGLVLAGPAIGVAVYENGRENAGSDLRRSGIVIPDQPADPNIHAPVIDHDVCGDPIYGPDQNAPFGPFDDPGDISPFGN